MKRHVKYSTYINSSTGMLYSFNHTTESLIDPYGTKKPIKNAQAFLLKAVNAGILKHVWSTDSKGKCIYKRKTRMNYCNRCSWDVTKKEEDKRLGTIKLVVSRVDNRKINLLEQTQEVLLCTWCWMTIKVSL